MTTTYTAAGAHAAVERGAAWLDEHCPRWFENIDLEKLDLADTHLCILGQTANCLIPVVDRQWPPMYLDVLRHYQCTSEWASEHGFESPFRGPGQLTYEMLTIAWALYIRTRLEALVPA